ncbi:MAG: hypothetical protein ACC647_03100 [Anaerolineales bacterium]
MNKRPFGVTALAILAALAAILAGFRTLQYLGIFPITIEFFFGDFSFRTFSLWAAFMWGLLTWIYIWLVRMLWNVEKEAWLFLAVITVFNLILDFIVLVSSNGSVEDMAASFVLNALILIYVMLPSTKRAFDMVPTGSSSSAPAPPPPGSGSEG